MAMYRKPKPGEKAAAAQTRMKARRGSIAVKEEMEREEEAHKQLQLARRKKHTDGTTALLVLFGGSDVNNLLLYTANLGDCRAVLCRGGVAMPRGKARHKMAPRRVRAAAWRLHRAVPPANKVWRNCCRCWKSRQN